MEITQKQLSELIYEAINTWDFNPTSKYFAVELAKGIKKYENKTKVRK